ncbi:MAG: ribonuclease E inhibitor RraB [Desulfatibacillaceae bacterium]
MTDHWEFFPCNINNQPATVVYDHGMAERINQLEIDTLVKIQVALKQPQEDGQPPEDERHVLDEVEAAVAEFAENHSGHYVGRLTLEGDRCFHVYANVGEHEVQGLAGAITANYGYEPRVALVDDPQKQGYWQDLFPTLWDWQLMQNLKLIRNLEDQGDDLTQPRPIYHFLFFQSREELDAFRSWAAEAGFTDARVMPPSKELPHFGLQLGHMGTPQLADINQTTLMLLQKAMESNAAYEGWHTKPADGQSAE